MGKITALHTGRRREKRINVFLDEKFAFSLQGEVAIKEGLSVGQELSGEQVKALTSSDQFQHCFNAATRYLSYRPRSESEVRGKLQRRGFSASTIEAALTKLKEHGLVDDIAFAEFWQDNRKAFSPRSQWLTKLELRQKGVNGKIIDDVVTTINDNESAYQAALSKAQRLPLSDYRGFRHRLGEYLKRRGFSYEVINNITERMWQELGSSHNDSIFP